MNPAEFGSLPADACTLDTEGSHGPDRIVKTIYDAAGRVVQVKTAFGTADQADEATSTYTANGLLATVTDGEGNRTTFEYDGHDRLEKTRFPDATQGAGTSSTSDYEQVTYETLAGGTRTSNLVAALRNRAGETIGYGYDALGRLISKDRPGSELDVTYGYDLLGRMISASQSGDSLTFAWDALGRQLSQTGASGSYSSTYDLAGRRTRLTHPDGFFVDQDYLVTGEMVAIRENGATSGVGVLATYAYDDLGRRTRLTLGNGAVTDYGYDPVSRLATLGHDLAGTAYDNAVTFTYNPASQIVGRIATNDAYAWTGHGSGSTSSSFDGLNRPVGDAHDARGNRLSDGTRTYAYDSENRSRGTAAAAFHYDPLGRLAGAGTPLAVHYENYIDDLIAERSPASSAVTRRHVFGPGVDEPLVWYQGAGTTDRRFLHADERGSIVAVTDGSGTVQNLNRYDEYGRVQFSNPNWLARFAFTGQRYFSGLGIYHFKNRMYDQKVGRFMQPDPIGYGAGPNLYAYVGGDPVNFADPMGLTPRTLDCTGTRLCMVHDGGASGSVAVFADLRGTGGGHGGGKDTSNNPDKGGFENTFGEAKDISNYLGKDAFRNAHMGVGGPLEEVSGTFLRATPTDSEGYIDVAMLTIERGIGARINETIVFDLREVKLITRFSTVVQCARCLSPLFGGSYDVRFLDPARRQVGATETVVGRIGDARVTKLDVPSGAHFMRFLPTILTPPVLRSSSAA